MALLEGGTHAMNERFFSEYRPRDYQLPRSRREAYGYEPVLWTDSDERDLLWWAGLLLWVAVVGLVIWYAYGWLP